MPSFQGLGGLETYVLEDEEARVEVIPSRGALVTRMNVAGDELLYLDESTVVDLSKNVRGGIPVLFPTAGKLPGDTYPAGRQSYTMQQHGFARRLPWTARARPLGGGHYASSRAGAPTGEAVVEHRVPAARRVDAAGEGLRLRGALDCLSRSTGHGRGVDPRGSRRALLARLRDRGLIRHHI